MAANVANESLPQWKKDLILRRRSLGKCLPGRQVSCSSGPGGVVPPFESHCVPDTGCRGRAAAGESSNSPRVVSVQSTTLPVRAPGQCDISVVSASCQEHAIATMVQNSNAALLPPSGNKHLLRDCVANGNECDSDSSEELQYGPGIVNKLKSKYLSLTLRECVNKSRPSILRRAASLEHMLDDVYDNEATTVEIAPPEGGGRRYATRDTGNGIPNSRSGQGRYRNSTRGSDSMKRARSVETLMRYNSVATETPSLSEDVVIIEKETTDKCPRKPVDNNRDFPDNKTLNQNKSCSQKINRPKRIAPLMDETERPPADVVKSKLKIFETSGTRRLRINKPIGEVAVKVDKFKTIIEKDKNKKKPVIKPKPVVVDKSKKPPTSPRKLPQVQSFESNTSNSDRSLSPIGKYRTSSFSSDTSLSPRPIIDEPIKCTIETPKPINELSMRPDVSKITELFEKSNSEYDNTRSSLSETPDILPKDHIKSSTIVNTTPPRSRSPTPVNGRTADICIPNTPPPDICSPAISPMLLDTPPLDEELAPAEPEITSPVPEPRHVVITPRTPSPRPVSTTPEIDQNDGTASRTISKAAIDSINDASATVHFQFDESTKSKSHLPGYNGHSSPSDTKNGIKRELPPLPPVPPRCIIPPNKDATPAPTNGIANTTIPTPATPTDLRPKTNGVLEPLRIITQIQKPVKVIEMPKPAATTAAPIANNMNVNGAESNNSALIMNSKKCTPHLTDREIEKNLINRVKTLEQPVSKVVVSVKSAEEVSKSATEGGRGPSKAGGGLWDQKPWHQQNSNTMVFNFSNRKEVPDYIENDGIIRRPKREKPKPGESGIILLADAPEDESCTDELDDDDWAISLRGPPSPCNVIFLNDNVLIDGRSSIKKLPKRQKLKIQFNDSATETFEYPSESSLIDETPACSTSTSTPSPAAPSPIGSSLSNYTPSKVVLSAELFQLGVTRAAQAPPVPPRNASSANYEPVQYLKPASEVDNVTWSHETLTDLLF